MADSKRAGSAKAKDAGNSGGADEKPQEEKQMDPRVEWLGSKVMKNLGVKPDKWKKMTLTDEYMCVPLLSIVLTGGSLTINGFFDNKDLLTLIFWVNVKEEPIPTTVFPPSLKRKALYFMKINTNLPTDKNNLTVGDIPPSPLEYLGMVLDEVYASLLSNPKNMASWPEVVATDVLRHFNKLKGAVYVVTGHSQVSYYCFILNHL